MVLAAGILLIIPGFFTDILGILLFVPGIRDLAMRMVRRLVPSSAGGTRASFAFHRSDGRGRVIDLDEEDFSSETRNPRIRRD
jgi:UPF0716 protein FxsA